MYDIIYQWGFAIGKKIIDERREEGDGEELVRRLIFNIRGEELPGGFLGKLSGTLAEYRTNVGLKLDVSLHPQIFEKRLWGDQFYYLKSAIISGLVNSLALESKKKKKEGENK